MPLWIRISATEWMEWYNEPSWDIQESIRLAKLLPGLGVDALDVSSGGNNSQQRIQFHPRYQTDLAGQIRAAVQERGLDLTIAAVGAVTEAEMARSLVDDNNEPHADLVVAARQFLRDPALLLYLSPTLAIVAYTPAILGHPPGSCVPPSKSLFPSYSYLLSWKFKPPARAVDASF